MRGQKDFWVIPSCAPGLLLTLHSGIIFDWPWRELKRLNPYQTYAGQVPYIILLLWLTISGIFRGALGMHLGRVESHALPGKKPGGFFLSFWSYFPNLHNYFNDFLNINVLQV